MSVNFIESTRGDWLFHWRKRYYGLNLKRLDGFITNMQLFKPLSEGLEFCGLLVEYFNVFLICFNTHSDHSHSLQRINWRASDVMLHFFKYVQMKKQTHLWWPEGKQISAHFYFCVNNSFKIFIFMFCFYTSRLIFFFLGGTLCMKRFGQGFRAQDCRSTTERRTTQKGRKILCTQVVHEEETYPQNRNRHKGVNPLWIRTT